MKQYKIHLLNILRLALVLMCIWRCEDNSSSYTPNLQIDSTGLMGLDNSAWPCDGHDSRRSSQSPYIGPDDTTVLWKYNASPGYHIESALSPSIDGGGNLYSMVWMSMKKLNPSGSLLWEASVGGYYLYSMPTIASNGDIYGTGYYWTSMPEASYGGLVVLDPTGNELWEYETDDKYDGGVSGAAAIASDGTIYLADAGSCLYAISPEGDTRWKYYLEHKSASSPAITKEGTIIVVDYLNNVYAVNPDGSLKWRNKINSNIEYDIAVSLDGTVYLSSELGIIALSAEGDIIWNFPLTEGVRNRVAIGNDQTIVFGAANGNIYALNYDGTEKWKYNIGENIRTVATIDIRGQVYIGSASFLYALSSSGMLVWKYPITLKSQPTIGEDGILYAGTSSGYIYAFGK